MNNSVKAITKCRICGSENLIPIISLGNLYVTGFIDPAKTEDQYRAPLELVLCDKSQDGCGLLQTGHTYPNEHLYKNYWYRSGVNQTMTRELHDIARSVTQVADLHTGDIAVDIGSNDSTLLDGYHVDGLVRVGFEPATNIVKNHNKVPDATIVNDFFNYEAFRERFGDKKAKVITAIAMFYDLDNPHTFVEDIAKCLDGEGLFVIQMNYLPFVLRRNAFDGICHEHLEFYSLDSLEQLLDSHNFEVFDVHTREEINEGSFRIYIRFKGGGGSLNIPVGAQERVTAIRADEQKLRLTDKNTYFNFSERINKIKEQTVSFINQERANGKTIQAYGASTKGGVLLQYFGLDGTIIDKVAERNPDKWGLKMVGVDIPIVSEAEMRADKPDYLLILPWHFLPEFLEREREFIDNGGKFIVPLPEFRVIGKDDIK